MQISCFRNRALQRLSLHIFLFSAFWFAGLLLGMIAAADLDDLFLPLMHPGRASIIRQIAAALLPFLFAAIAAYLKHAHSAFAVC